jgi:hypothetical protein
MHRNLPPAGRSAALAASARARAKALASSHVHSRSRPTRLARAFSVR